MCILPVLLPNCPGKRNPQRVHYAGCYEDSSGMGSSGPTYRSGFRAVMKHLGPAVSIYENVKSVAEQTRSATGDIHRPVIEVVKEDVEALGYRFVLQLHRRIYIYFFSYII